MAQCRGFVMQHVISRSANQTSPAFARLSIARFTFLSPSRYFFPCLTHQRPEGVVGRSAD
jgi:hypothetical protein